MFASDSVPVDGWVPDYDLCYEAVGTSGSCAWDKHKSAASTIGGDERIAQAGSVAGTDVSDGLTFVDPLEDIDGGLVFGVGERPARRGTILGTEVNPGGEWINDFDDSAFGRFCGG